MAATFNANALRGLELRTREMRVPELAPLFDGLAEGEAPAITIRQLTGDELAQAREAARRNQEARQLRTEAERAGWSDERLAAMRQLIGGTDDEVPDDHARYLTIVRLGCVEPRLNEEQCVQLARFYGAQFFAIAQAIMGLSGQGAAPKKQKASGKSRG